MAKKFIPISPLDAQDERRNARVVLDNLNLGRRYTGRKAICLKEINPGRRRIGLGEYTSEELEQIEFHASSAIEYGWVRQIGHAYIITLKGLGELATACRPSAGTPTWDGGNPLEGRKVKGKRYYDTKIATGALPLRV